MVSSPEQAITAESPESPPVLPLRQNRDFLLFWVGQAVSAFGSHVSAMAYPLVVLAVTGSPASAGLVGFLGMIPNALLQLPAGALVDRWDRKRVMLTTDAARVVVLAVVAVALMTEHASLPLLATTAFVEGCLSVFFGAAQPAAIRHIVPESQVTAAIAQDEARVRGASLLGRPLGGVLFGVGRSVPFLVDALSYLASLLTLGSIRVRFNDERTAPQQHLVAEIRDGVVWLWRQRFLRACILLVAGSNFAFEALTLSVVVLERDHGATSAQIGLMLGGFGAGGLLGAFAAPWLQPHLAPRVVVVGANWVWAALVPPILLVSNPYLIGALIGGMAFVGPLWNVVIGAYMIRLTPDALLSRVMSVGGLIAFGVIPFGSLVAGFLLEASGAKATLLFVSAWMLAMAIAATVNRSVRQAPALA